MTGGLRNFLFYETRQQALGGEKGWDPLGVAVGVRKVGGGFGRPTNKPQWSTSLMRAETRTRQAARSRKGQFVARGGSACDTIRSTSKSLFCNSVALVLPLGLYRDDDAFFDKTYVGAVNWDEGRSLLTHVQLQYAKCPAKPPWIVSIMPELGYADSIPRNIIRVMLSELSDNVWGNEDRGGGVVTGSKPNLEWVTRLVKRNLRSLVGSLSSHSISSDVAKLISPTTIAEAFLHQKSTAHPPTKSADD
ncbi:hypothetical protein BGZ63DRAFT_400104 [Mariannaea sp. PMI_226]|nr:hypothetical protein BGZ63DRAFT_400104 [Mariannaea sp. PMI_226]